MTASLPPASVSSTVSVSSSVSASDDATASNSASAAARSAPLATSVPASPASVPLHCLDSTAGLMTRFTAQLTAQLRARHTAAHPSFGGDGPVLVAVAHGSRDPAASRTVRALLDAVRAARPGLRVTLAHLELDEPSLSEALAAIPSHRQVALVPLLFGPGHHVKHDIPRAVAASPHPHAAVAAPLGPHPLLAEALLGRLNESYGNEPCGNEAYAADEPHGPDAVVLACAGSRDPESADSARRTAARLRERLGGSVPVLPAYASAARPTVAEAVRTLRAAGHRRIALASCFTAPGHFAARCAAEAPWAVSAPLGAHPALARLVLHRFDEARAAARAARPAPSGDAAVSAVTRTARAA
ncbi:sirohydrochlorin ferrochelatase [Streptomyces sp. Amel2xB2]|nr:sirohydrochlorin ferrochelatase [Streptomyces sp. Amel2xB2]